MGIDAEVDTSQGGDIIQTLKDEIFCSICCAIFEDPLKLNCCDGHLCKTCFDDVKSKFSTCPLCRADNYSAKPSRLMVSVLSTITLTCPAEECKEKFLYNQFKQHKETCTFLNMKVCDKCNLKMDLPEFERHFACTELLLNSYEEIKKKCENQKQQLQMFNGKQKAHITKINELNLILGRNQEHIRQLQLTNVDQGAQLHRLQQHNQMGSAQNLHIASENEHLKKSLKDLNSKMAKLQKDHETHIYQLREDNRMLQNSVNEKTANEKKTKDTLQNQANRLKNLEAENKSLKQAAKQTKDKKKNAVKANVTQSDADKKLEALQNDYQLVKSNYDHLADLFCQGDDTDNCKTCKTKMVADLLPENETEKEKHLRQQNTNLDIEIARLNRVVSTQRDQHQSAKKELEKRVKKTFEAKITNLETKIKQQDGALEKINAEKSSLLSDIERIQTENKSIKTKTSEKHDLEYNELKKSNEIILKNEKENAKKLADVSQQLEDMRAKVEARNREIARINEENASASKKPHPLSEEVTKNLASLKKQNAHLQQQAQMYYQMFENERRLNQPLTYLVPVVLQNNSS